MTFYLNSKGDLVMALYELNKQFEEKIDSPFEKDTREDALAVLAAIRAARPASAGWIEYNSGVEQLYNGKWHAYCHYAKYE